MEIKFGVGVFIADECRRILVGDRGDGQGLCVPGGKVEKGEAPAITADREVMEETGLLVHACRFLGEVTSTEKVNGSQCLTSSKYYFTDKYSGDLKETNELLNPRFITIDELVSAIEDGKVFRPTADAYNKLYKQLEEFLYGNQASLNESLQTLECRKSCLTCGNLDSSETTPDWAETRDDVYTREFCKVKKCAITEHVENCEYYI